MELLQDQLDRNKLVKNLCTDDSILSLIRGIGEVVDDNAPVARDMCTLLNIKNLAHILAQTNDPSDVCLYLSKILRANDEVGSQLWAALDIEQLAGRVGTGTWTVMACLKHLAK